MVGCVKTILLGRDFLLGITDYPDRMNYEVGQLGLTPEAVRKLRSGAVNIGTMVEKGKKVTPEIIADVVLGKVVEACDLEANALDAFRQPIIDLMKKTPRRKKLE